MAYALRYPRRRRISVVTLIILLNLACYILWVFADWVEFQSAGSFIDEQFMHNHFLVSWSSLTEGRYWTLLTPAFSHNMFWHFLINMYVLNSFGRIVELILEPRRFLYFYLAAAIVSSFSHAMVSRFLIEKPDLPALGASGAVAGIVLLFSLLYPKEKIAILGIIPVPAILGAFLFVAIDIWGLIAQAEGGGLPIGHGAHLGGAFTGILYYFFIFKSQSKNDFITVNRF